ncbi:MAG: hypothetical protein KC613_06515, partial [Myxococcales bacterium]|nr:hypothetical protein [Myxococcales bacterium]
MSPVRARLALVLGLGAGPALAAPPPGDYVLVEGHRSFDIEAWGPDCGPQPDAQRHGPGARYRLDAEGWLRAQGGAPPVFQPDICAAATGIPSMRGGRGGGGRVRCANPVKAQPVKGQARLLDGDPNALTVLERFEYDWVLKGTACKLTQHARWTLRRDPPLDRCRAPGPAARLSRVGAASQRGRSGQALQFRVQTEDAEGCPVAAEPTWQASLGRITDKGVLQLGAGDAGRSGTVTATLDGQSVVWSLTVAAAPAPQPGRVVSSAAEELVPDWDEDGALEVEADLGLAPQAGSAVTAEVTAPPPASGPSPLVVGLFIGLGLAALAIAVWIGLSARRLRRAGAAQGLLEAARRPAPPGLPRMSSSTPPPDGRA